MGRHGESETPSSDYLALKSEEAELNEPSAAPLDEIISKRDTASSHIQSTVDTSGHLRVTRTKSKAKMPSNTEEYRKIMKVEMYAWLCMSARYRAKNWLHGLEAADFTKFVDFILGERVMGIQIPTSDGGQQKLKPDWSIVLAFEHKLRKEAMRLVANEGYTLANALRTVTRDADLKEASFTTPVALRAAASDGQQNKWPRYNSKGSFSAGKSMHRVRREKGHEENRRAKIRGWPGFNWHGGLRMDAIYVLHTILVDVTTVATEFINAESRVVTATTRPFNIKRRAAVAIDRQGVAFRSPALLHTPTRCTA